MSLTTNGAGDPYGNLGGLLWRAARQWRDKEAIIHQNARVTYGELCARASVIGAALRNRGITPADRVALLQERGADAVAAIFAVMAVGAVAVCINDRLRPRQIEHMLRHSGARALLTTPEMLARNSRPFEADAEIVSFSEIPTTSEERLDPLRRVTGDLAQIIYTSGSTGLPKGVCFTHGALGAGVEIVSTYLGIRDTDRIASLLAFSSIYGLNQLLCAVRRGATLVIETSPVPDRIVRSFWEHSVTLAAAVPPLWVRLLSVPSFRKPIESLRLLQNAGGHLPAVVTRRLREAQPQAKVYLQYGMTETFRSTFLPPEEVDRRPDCMGRAMPGTEILVLRDDLTSCEPGETGELVHRGPTVAAGYWNDPVATSAVFRRNPLQLAGVPSDERVVFSGDLVRRDEEGFLYYIARRDRVIKTLGFRVGPDEIADVLFSSGEINECVVTTEPDAERGQRIVAFVVLLAGGSLDRLKRFSRRELPPYMQPARVVSVDALPRLASGKYDVAALRSSLVTV